MPRATGPGKGTANSSFVEFRYFSLSFSVVGDYLHHVYATLRTPAAKIGEANLVRMLSRTLFIVVIINRLSVLEQEALLLFFSH